MKKVTSVKKTQIVKTQRDLTDANARLVSMEMDTTAQVSQCLFGSLVVVNSLEKIQPANINELQEIILLGTARILRRFLSIQ